MLRTKKQQQCPGEWVDRGWYLVTEFERSSSINFPKALTLAQTHPGFIQLMDERSIVIYRNIYREHDVRQFQELYALVKNWKGTRLYFKGDETSYESIESGIRCYIKTKLDHAPEDNHNDDYDERGNGCKTFTGHHLETSQNLGCIGCRRSGISMDWPPEAKGDRVPWFFYGRLDQHHVYNFNKDELQHFVYGHLVLYNSCPLLDLEQIAEFIQRLPDRVDPRKDREWEYRKAGQHELPNRFYKIPDVLPKTSDAYRMYLKRHL